MHTFQETVSARGIIPTNRCSKRLLVGALALVLGLFAFTANSHADTFIWTNTAASANWSDVHTWATQGIPPLSSGNYPTAANGDGAIMTNAGTYTVSFDIDPATIFLSNDFNNASNTLAVVTLDLNGNNYFINANGGGDNDAMRIADTPTSTAIVYVASSGTLSTQGFQTTGRTLIGTGGEGTLIVTNGIYNTGTVTLGPSPEGRGHLEVYGPGIVTNYGQLMIGSTNSYGNDCVVSNGGFIYVRSWFMLGCSQTGGSSNNTVTIGPGGVIFTAGDDDVSGVVGKAIPDWMVDVYPAVGAYNNTMLIMSNGTYNGNDNENGFFIGWAGFYGDNGPAAGNVVRVLAGGGCTNLYYTVIQADIIDTNLYVIGTGYVTMTYTDPYFATNNNTVSRFYRIRQVP